MPKTRGSKASSNRVIQIAGFVDGQVKILDLVVARKNIIRGKRGKSVPESRSVRRGKELLGIVSHPAIFKSATAEYVKAWCHPYREPEKYLSADKPQLLLSESDFVDEVYIDVVGRNKIECDYFYFTLGGEKSQRRKGFSNFIELLPHLCRRKLKGKVINYGRADIFFQNEREVKIWRKYINRYVKYEHTKYIPRELTDLMTSCKFGIFPNESDCSPLLLTESLVRNTPVLVNQNILGGWKYVNEETGVFFDPVNPSDAIDFILNNNFNANKRFMSEFGFCRSAKRLADFGRQHFVAFENCSLACFSGLSSLLNKCEISIAGDALVEPADQGVPIDALLQSADLPVSVASALGVRIDQTELLEIPLD